MAKVLDRVVATRYPVEGKTEHRFKSVIEARSFCARINQPNEVTAKAVTTGNYAVDLGWKAQR
jgi:hypothetical protein